MSIAQVLTLSVGVSETWRIKFSKSLSSMSFLDNTSVVLVQLLRVRDCQTLRPFALHQGTRRNRRTRGLSSSGGPSTRDPSTCRLSQNRRFSRARSHCLPIECRMAPRVMCASAEMLACAFQGATPWILPVAGCHDFGSLLLTFRNESITSWPVPSSNSRCFLYKLIHQYPRSPLYTCSLIPLQRGETCLLKEAQKSQLQIAASLLGVQQEKDCSSKAARRLPCLPRLFLLLLLTLFLPLASFTSLSHGPPPSSPWRSRGCPAQAAALPPKKRHQSSIHQFSLVTQLQTASDSGTIDIEFCVFNAFQKCEQRRKVE